MDKSKIFIASSSRTLVLAEKLRDQLDNVFCQATLWSEESRASSGSTIIEMLEVVPRQHDFAVIFLAKDDVLTSGDRQNLKARDNCVFEAGLFMSAIGRKRCFLVNSVSQSDLPSDLGGIISITFEEPANLQDRKACADAIIRVAAQVKDTVQRDGPLLSVDKIQITITSPVNGGFLEDGKQPRQDGWSYPVRGTVTHLPSDHEIWILNEGLPSREVWPQGKHTIRYYPERSEWEGQTFLWSWQDSVTIVAVAAPPLSHEMFAYYTKVHEHTGKAVPLSRLPVECTIVARVQARQR